MNYPPLCADISYVAGLRSVVSVFLSPKAQKSLTLALHVESGNGGKSSKSLGLKTEVRPQIHTKD